MPEKRGFKIGDVITENDPDESDQGQNYLVQAVADIRLDCVRKDGQRAGQKRSFFANQVMLVEEGKTVGA